MKYFLCIILSVFTIKTIAQKQDTVRWFVGHWVDKKTFKIDSTIYGKGGGGGTITVKQNGSIDISTPESKDFDKAINEAITSIEKEEKDITDMGKAGESMYQYNLVSQSVKELEKVKEEYKIAADYKNAYPPLSPEAMRNLEVASAVEQSCIAFEPEYHRIIDFYKAHRKEKNPHFDLPPPPEADYFNCWGCDTAKQIEFDTLCIRYATNIFKDIGRDLKLIIGVAQQMEAVGLAHRSSDENIDPAIRDAYSLNKNRPGACSYLDYYDMMNAIDFYLNRGYQMAEQLLKDNKNNYKAVQPVIRICMNIFTQKMALAGINNSGGEAEEIATLARPLENLYDTITYLLFKKHDYRMMRMIPFTMGLFSAIPALKAYNRDPRFDDSFNPRYNLFDLAGFMKFELSIDLDTKIGEKGNYTIAHLKSKSKVIVEFDDKECIKFTLAKKEEGKIKADIITNEAIATGPHGVYVGTKTYTSQSPIFKIRFCEMPDQPKGDSLYLSTFVPLAPDKGNWNVQGKMAPLGINSADRLFINIEDLKNDAQNIKPEVDQKQLEDIQKNALEMAAKLKAMQAGGNIDPSKMGDMVKKLMNNSGAVIQTQTSQLLRIKLPLKINNMDKMLINQRFDAKEINPAIAQPFVYAYLTIKLEHTPTNNKGEDLNDQ